MLMHCTSIKQLHVIDVISHNQSDACCSLCCFIALFEKRKADNHISRCKWFTYLLTHVAEQKRSERADVWAKPLLLQNSRCSPPGALSQRSATSQDQLLVTPAHTHTHTHPNTGSPSAAGSLFFHLRACWIWQVSIQWTLLRRSIPTGLVLPGIGKWNLVLSERGWGSHLHHETQLIYLLHNVSVKETSCGIKFLWQDCVREFLFENIFVFIKFKYHHMEPAEFYDWVIRSIMIKAVSQRWRMFWISETWQCFFRLLYWWRFQQPSTPI